MIFELLKKAIQDNNAFMSRDMIELQVEFFYTANKLTETEYNTLKEMLNPVVETPME